jgi:hypothetical protein
MGAGAAILACAVVLLLPILMGAAFYDRNFSYYRDAEATSAAIYFWNIALAEMVSISWGLVVSAMTLFFSARCRRGFIALGTVLAILVASLIVWPILISAADLMGNDRTNLLNFFHPFWTIGQIESANTAAAGELLWQRIYGVPQLIVYVGMTAVFLYWTERTLRFADGEVSFLPRHKDA